MCVHAVCTSMFVYTMGPSVGRLSTLERREEYSVLEGLDTARELSDAILSLQFDILSALIANKRDVLTRSEPRRKTAIFQIQRWSD